MSTTGIRLKPLPPPMIWPPPAALPPPAATRALPSYPDPEQHDESVSLHDGDFEEVWPAESRPVPMDPPPVVYAVYAGCEPGELVLRAVAPDEPAPEGVLVARLERVHVRPSR